MIFSENWHDLGLQVSIKHFMCTLLDEMELVRNLGHMSKAGHRIWLGGHGQATEFRKQLKSRPTISGRNS